MNRRKRALLRRSTRPDTFLPADTLAVRHKEAYVPVDSTARIEQFIHDRRDAVSAVERLRTEHPLYLRDPGLIRMEARLDTAQWMYTLRYLLGANDVRTPVILPMEEYVRIRLDYAIRQNWDDMIEATGYQAAKKEGLGELFGKVTNIEIPVPKNPIFSIFGPNIIRLQINGSVNIHAAFRNTKSDQFIASPLGQSRNEPDFNQEVQVTLKGEIGDKLRIDADWNTQRTFEYENQLKVRYTGYEDEIVQSVEAGNVSLPTSSAFIPPSSALFGIKAGFQFGPLKLTTVASQKKGQIKELTVSGGARPTPFERRPVDYSRDHYFIDTAYIGVYEDIFYKIPATPNINLQIQEMEVWVTSTSTFDQRDRNLVAFMSADSVFQKQGSDFERTRSYDPLPGEVEVGKFSQLTDGVDYTFEPNAGIISINKPLQADQAIAVAFLLQNSEQFGNFGMRDTATSKLLIMKLVRPRNLQPQFKTAWRLMLKNRYPLGGRGVKKEGFEFRIEYIPSGGTPLQDVLPENINLLELYGLDRYLTDGTGGQDKTFDYLPRLTIDEHRGEIIFPFVEPFRAERIEQLLLTKGINPTLAGQYADSFSFNAIYDTTYNGALNDRRNQVYRFVGNITPSTASNYNLGFNIVEGSVEVVVDGQKATPNVDYTVDYITGVVVIKNLSFLVPGRNLQIRYEANDLFQLASKSLVGARGEFDLGSKSALGFTIMNLNQQSLSDKVRIGEEPTSNTIMGIDGQTAIDAPFVTKALNWLPGIRTMAPSSMSLRGEAAYMAPDPNTRKSSIPQDGGKGIAYIDDFEGARRTTPLNTSYTSWRDASSPFYVPGLDPFAPVSGIDTISTSDPSILANILPDSTRMQHKAKLIWFNVLPSDVYVQDIWGDRRSVARGQDQVSVLNLYFQPSERGAYNYSLDLEGRLEAQPAKSWAGIQRMLGTTASNLLDENISFLEMWVNIYETSPSAILRVNLGYISEDVVPNKVLNTEDGLDGGVINGTVNKGEDIGIDRLTDTEERNVYQSFIAKYTRYAGDPSGDNWGSPPLGLDQFLDGEVSKRYAGGNGYENSSGSELGGRFPDTEDINGNNILDRVNGYYEYEIALDTLATGFQRYVVGGGENGWYQVRIPLNEFRRQIGSASFTNIESVRLWIGNASTPVLVRIAELNLVGNQWEELKRNDPTFKVSTVNVEDNPSYEIPPGVQRELDRTRPDDEVYGNEQSLNLVMTNLPDGETRQAIKRYSIRPLDLFNYRAMKMFIHGEQRPGMAFRYVDSTNYDAEIFLRFGTDSLNFYEYRAPVRPGWDPLNDITILFSDLSAIKLVRDSAGAPTGRVPVPNGAPGATFQIRGEPTLNRVTYISVGVENPAGKGVAFLSGEVWANELRLTDVDDTPGWAYRFETTAKFADVAGFQFSMQKRDPFFHGIEERFGSRMDKTDWTLSANIGLEKFLPDSWGGTQLGVTYSHVESMQKPRYMPGTDILVQSAAERIDVDTSTTRARAANTGEELKIQTQELSVTETYAVPAIKLNIPLKSWLVTETINRMTFGFSYTNNVRRSPTVRYSQAWSWNARFGYAIPFAPTTFIEPFSSFGEVFMLSLWKQTKIYYAPRQVSVTASLQRGQSRSQARNQIQQNPVSRTFQASRSIQFNWPLVENGLLSPSLDFQADIGSNMSHLEVDQFGNQRSLTDILRSALLGEKPLSFGFDTQYGQTISLSTRPVVPKVLMLDRIITPTLRYSSRYDWSRNLQAGDLGRGAGWSSNLTAGLDVNLKTISEQIWSNAPAAAPVPGDTTGKPARNALNALDAISRILIKNTILDFEKFNISFSQQNRAQNSGVLGRPGFANVFARVPFIQSSLPENGPSLLYQLGLSSDPHGDVVIGTKGTFPFIRGSSVPGIRAPRGNLTDVFSQSNKVSMRTSRTLWEGASIDLNWNVSWSYNASKTVITDSLGIPSVRSRTVSGDLDRSFFSLPPVFVFKLFKTGVEDVNKKFERMRIDRGDTRPDEVKISEAFVEGMEALPILAKILGSFAPRANWSIRWDGLEKFALFQSWAARVTLDHVYTSNYRQRWRLSPQGEEVAEGQGISYAFSPLLGVNISFKEFIKGSLGAQFRYGTSTAYDLTPSVQNIVESGTEDISVTASYSRQGFEFPLFGLSLSNDLMTTLSYTYTRNARKLYNLKENFKPEGQPLDGSNRTTIEPRIRYILSSRVTASLYYRYSKTAPDAGGSKITGNTINEGGLDVQVSIQ